MKSKIYFLACLIFIFPCGGVFAASSENYILDYDSISGGADSSASESYYMEGGVTSIESDGGSADYSVEPLRITNICGNGIIEDGEACEAGVFNGVTCTILGFKKGGLICNNDCLSINTSGCSNQSGGSGGSGSSGGSSGQPPQNSSQPTSPPQSTPHPTAMPQNTAQPTSPPQNTPQPTLPPQNTPQPTSLPQNTPQPTSTEIVETQPAQSTPVLPAQNIPETNLPGESVQEQPFPADDENFPQAVPATPQKNDSNPNTATEETASQQTNGVKNPPSAVSPGKITEPENQTNNQKTSASEAKNDEASSAPSLTDTSISSEENIGQAKENAISVFEEFINKLEPDSPVSNAATGISEKADSIISAIRDALPFSKNINEENSFRKNEDSSTITIEPSEKQHPVVEVQKQLVTSDPEPLITGKFAVTEKSFIRVTEENGDSVLVGDIQQNDDGSFTFIPDKPLADGKFNITVYGMKDGENFKVWERVVIVDRQLEEIIAVSRVSLSIEGNALNKSGGTADIGPIIKKKADQSVIRGKSQPHQKITGYLERTSGVLPGDLAAQIFSSQNKKTFAIEVTADNEGKFEIALPPKLQSGRYSLRLIPSVENADSEYVLRENSQVIHFSYATRSAFAPVFIDGEEPPSLFQFTIITVTIGVALIGLLLVFVFQRRLPRKKRISKRRS